jgi:hypothetical protein
MTLNAVATAALRGTYAGSNDLAAVLAEFSALTKREVTFSPGTGANQADKLFLDTRTISASSSENLDLAGSLTDPNGATLTFATVKAILVLAAAANTNNVVVGGAASNGFVGPFGDATDTIAVKPGGAFLWVAPATGATVTASTGDILKVANSSSGSSVSYSVAIIGTSA